MKRAVSRAQWILLVVSVALATGAWVARRELPLGRFPANAEFAALHAEAEQLHGADDRTRDEWRQRVHDLQRAAWTEADLAALERRLGPEWTRGAELTVRDNGLRRLEFSREGAPLGVWPEFVRMIAEFEARPGMRLVALDLTAGGVGVQRRFTRMAFAVQVIWAESNGNAERSAFLGPLPVSPPLPAAPRERTGAAPFESVPALRAGSRSASLTQN